jgi:hypothetical protein
MRKALQVLGLFLSFVFIRFGTAILALSLEIVLRPNPDLSTWSVYTIESRSIQGNSAPFFYVGCRTVAAKSALLWFQRKKSD